MNKLWVLAFVLGVAAADVGLNYDHKVPQTSYGVPSYQFHGTSGQNIGYTDSSLIGYNYKQPVNKLLEHGSSGDYISTATTQKLGGPSYHSTVFQHGTSGSSGDIQNHPSLISNFGLNSGSIYAHSAPHYQTNSEYISSAVQKYQQYYIHQPAEVYRHFYVHSVPEEPEPPKPKRPVVLPPPQKHIKIIFVKAPTESRSPQIVPVAPQNEEKTIVYVLVKKPDEQEVIVPKVEQKPPTKPEVYYIKYNNKHDSQAVIDNIVNDYNKGNVLTGSNHDFNPNYNSHLQYGQSGSSTSGHFGGSVISTPIQAPTPTTLVINGISKESGSYGTTAGQHSTGHFPSGYVTNGGLSPGKLSTGSQSTEVFSTGGLPAGGVTTGTLPVTSLSPAGSTTTVSSLLYNHANSIPTSQGVPHETYGPPKFRPN